MTQAQPSGAVPLVCRSPNKRGYAAREEAASAAEAFMRRFDESRPQRPYRCPCGLWHLTSKDLGGADHVPDDLVPVDADEELLAGADAAEFDAVVRRDLRGEATLAEALSLRHPAHLDRWDEALKARWAESEEHLGRIRRSHDGTSRAWRSRINGFRAAAQVRRLELERRQHEHAHRSRPRDLRRERARRQAMRRLIADHAEEFGGLLEDVRGRPAPAGAAAPDRGPDGAAARTVPAPCPTPAKERFAGRLLAQARADAFARLSAEGRPQHPYFCPCGSWHLGGHRPEHARFDPGALRPAEADEALLGRADSEQFTAVAREDLHDRVTRPEALSLRHPGNLPRWGEALKLLWGESELRLQQRRYDRSGAAEPWREEMRALRVRIRSRIEEQERRWTTHRASALLLDKARTRWRDRAMRLLAEARPVEFERYLREALAEEAARDGGAPLPSRAPGTRDIRGA